jgi:hypothetical protein
MSMHGEEVKTYALVDGILAGTALSNSEDDVQMETGGIHVTQAETKAIRYALRAIKAGTSIEKIERKAKADPEAELRKMKREDEEGIELIVETQGKAITALFRKNNRRKGKWFLNIQGNPTSTFSGDNTFGDLRIATKVIAMFHQVLDRLSNYGVNTTRLRKEVEEGNIYINSISFANYLTPVKDEDMLRQLVKCWYSMYETRLETKSEGKVSLLQELALKRAVGDQFESSIPLAIYGPNDKKCVGAKYMHVCFYDKAEEKRVKNKLEEGSEEAEDLGKRLRIDLTVSNHYLNSFWHLKGKVTLREMYEWVERKYGKQVGWSGAVQDLMTYALRRTCLLYMFVAPNPFLKKHRELRLKWQEEHATKRPRNGERKWSKEVQEWALGLGLDPEVSPLAHKIIKQGQLDYHTHTEEMTKLWVSGPEGQAEYVKRMSHLIKEVRNNTMLTSVIRKLVLENSVPQYLNET